MSSIRWLPVCALLLASCAPARSAVPLNDFVVVDGPQGLAGIDFATRRQTFSSTPAVPSADWSSLFTSDAGQVSRLEARTGARLETIAVPAALQAVAVSTDGRKIALAAPEDASSWPPVGRTTSRIVVADTSGRTEPRSFDLTGNIEPDAFSSDNTALFVLDYQPPQAPEHYSVRRLDLRTGAVIAVGSRFKGVVPDETMRGTRHQHVYSPDRKTLYTLYTNQPDHLHSRDLAAGLTVSTGEYYAFVHVLNLSEGWAFCLDLPQPFGMDPAEAHALALSNDGKSLFVVDRASGTVLVADAVQLSVRTISNIGADPSVDRASAVVGRDNTLYVSGANQIVALNPSSLSLEHRIPSPVMPSGLGMSGDGQRLFVLSADALYALDATSGAELGRLSTSGALAIAHVSP